MGRHVALLRGINVGGKNRLPMKVLSAMFVAAGCSDVQTYIQSGNVAFTASDALARRLPAAISAAIEDQAGLTVPVMTRSLAELRSVVVDNPFLKADAEEKSLHVLFLADKPKANDTAALDAGRSPPDVFEVRGREIFLMCPNGLARTKLTNAYFDAKLKTTSTARNWRTVQQLVDLAAAG